MTTIATAPTTLIGDLILARLLAVGKHPPGPKSLRDQFARILKKDPLNAEQWQALIDELAAAGLMMLKPYRLTDAGRSRALEFLSIQSEAELDGLPSRTRWEALQTRYLVPKALGVGGDAREEVRKSVDKLKGLVLKRHYDLPIVAVPTVAQAMKALTCKLISQAMGIEVQTNLEAIAEAVLSPLLGTTDRLDKTQLAEQLPRHVVGTTKGGMRELRAAILTGWVHRADRDSLEPATPTEEVFDLAAFTQTVQAVARDCPVGRFGDNKVFISHVWRHLRHEPSFPPLDLPEFKARLTEANHEGLIRLSRADLVQAMNPVDVQESETSYLNAFFHFILIEGDRP
jgi:hypothetical protein